MTRIIHEDYFTIELETCACCYGRKTEDYTGSIQRWRERPICYAFRGLIEGGLWRMTGERFKVTETACIAHGQSKCVFQIPKTPLPKET